MKTTRFFILCGALLVGLLAWASPALAAPPAQQADTRPLCYFQITTTDWRQGFYVCDDPVAQMRSAYYRQPFYLGWPVSRRFIYANYPTQAFEKGLLQWQPGGPVLINIFDDLSRAGKDTELFVTRQVPYPLPAGWDGTTDFQEIVRRRQALLDERPALRRAYFAVRDPLSAYGLPTSLVTDMGNHYAIRLQRGVLQEWKEDVPWARAGQVTSANSGVIAAEFGLIPQTIRFLEPTPYIPNVAGAPDVPGIPRGGPAGTVRAP